MKMPTFRNGYILSLPGFGKLSTIIIGLIVLIIGLRSHYQSAWTDSKYYKVCEIYILHYTYQEPCPSIGMERYYVAVIILCFILSIIGTILSVSLVNPYLTVFWIVDLVYHILASLLLIVAAVLYLVSAVQINNHPLANDDAIKLPPGFIKFDDTEVFLSKQKIYAAGLTFVQALFYIIVALLIKRGRSKSLQE
ncbi:hypothetical protein Ocin01_13643 [Orchesella cincta]|uniref:MARVEL domain-containing protein n=1 Tax=Orchesella cincta TaxID=48709 RepID=A0A1D2MJ33_ORCCI|nr:hypothetical protein Ocin01_13643 [Orchesella cincta]